MTSFGSSDREPVVSAPGLGGSQRSLAAAGRDGIDGRVGESAANQDLGEGVWG
ncbi:MAG: hypothetical protein R3E12_16855 [Candidatus Eisenbacteria bacterium]